MNKTFFCFMVSLFFFQSSMAQKEKDSLVLNLDLKFGKQALELNKTYISKNSDTLQLSAFKFYISNFEIEYADQSVYQQKNSYHLIDIENPNSLQIAICKKNTKTISKIHFNMGIDSTASVSGALSGDLDPANGMYWAWQSGYINMKVEGKSPSCVTRKNQFQFHLGGYLKPNYAMRRITLFTKPDLNVVVDISELFSKVHLREFNSIMIPGKVAMQLADYSTHIFKIE